MIVGMWMSRNLICTTADTLISEAANLMSTRRIRRLIVVQREGMENRLMGIVSASDILHAYPPDVNPFTVITREAPQPMIRVGEIMYPAPLTVPPELPIEEAALLMRNRKIGALPVLREEKLAGIITESDIFKAFVSIFNSPQPGVRITFTVARFEDAFGLISGLTQNHDVHVLSLVTSVQGEVPVCVVRLAGKGVEAMLDEIWKSEHRVMNVLRIMPGGAE